MDLSISQMMQLQKDLFVAHGSKWAPMEPEYGQEFILNIVEEIGEVITIVRKKGDNTVVSDPVVRDAFLEEMSDVLMYYMEILLRYHVTPEEISEAYKKKHDHNMGRNYKKQYEEMLSDGEK